MCTWSNGAGEKNSTAKKDEIPDWSAFSNVIGHWQAPLPWQP